MTYVIARTGRGRPTLQHRLIVDSDQTACGLDVTQWSRAYSAYPIAQVLCKKCERSVR